MGQRAALLLIELLLLLLLTASRTLLAVSFPEDSVPLNVADAHCEYTHANEPSRDRKSQSLPLNWKQTNKEKSINSMNINIFTHSSQAGNEEKYSVQVSSLDTSML